MTFYICHCGNMEENHYFRHVFEKCSLIIREKEQENIETFILNANDFPEKTGEKCSIPNCNGKINIHETILLNHRYIPTVYNYREIKFCIPKNSQCHYKYCCKKLSEHSNVMTHHFTTKVKILNKKDSDIIWLFDKDDEDLKILNS